MKTCLDCGISKCLTDFPVATGRVNGRGSYCKVCMRARSKASYRKRMAEQGKRVIEPEQLAPGQKRCRDCLAVKPFEDFPRNKNLKDGRHSYCKTCHNARGKDTVKRLYGTSRDYHLRRRYGLQDGEWDEIMLDQGDVCAICRESPAVHVDHDHDTGEVRGILCFNCNGGLGQFRDRVDIMRNAIDYLERTRTTLWPRTWVCTDDFLPTSPPRAAAASATSSELPPPTCSPRG
ncbi:MAG: endonuclease VII domain-containing protein [Mycobacteriales bacterium]